jgi:hypothetical protein
VAEAPGARLAAGEATAGDGVDTKKGASLMKKGKQITTLKTEARNHSLLRDEISQRARRLRNTAVPDKTCRTGLYQKKPSRSCSD